LLSMNQFFFYFFFFASSSFSFLYSLHGHLNGIYQYISHL